MSDTLGNAEYPALQANPHHYGWRLLAADRIAIVVPLVLYRARLIVCHPDNAIGYDDGW